MATQTSERKERQSNLVQDHIVDDDVHPIDDIVEYAKLYAREKPESAALICIAVGFVLGWKLKPW